MLYMKKSEQVEAVQYTESNGTMIGLWSNGIATESPDGEGFPFRKKFIEIKTDMMFNTANIGDYIVKEQSGVFHAIPKIIFEDVYVPIAVKNDNIHDFDGDELAIIPLVKGDKISAPYGNKTLPGKKLQGLFKGGKHK